jgi:SAM-dependent methyltransferase
MPNTPICPNCQHGTLESFYEVRSVPVHSVLLLPTREEAIGYPTGDIVLGFCPACGFIANMAFDPRLHEYSDRYEETQGYSETFNAFACALAQRLIDRYDLHGKTILEIGCGKGEFLTAICEMGGNTGIGIDPAYVASRSRAAPSARVRFIADFYSESYAHLRADFVICKMTLEHIPNTLDFMRMIRRTMNDQPETTVFFQIPDVTRVLSELGFWDIYYEHCTYFSPGSLARLFRAAGFDLLDLGRDYGDQYLMIECRPGSGGGRTFPALETDLDAIAAGVRHFAQGIGPRLAAWRAHLRDMHAHGGRVVLWGSGSKGVAFLTTLGIRDEIAYTVDINPHKHDHFMAGTGQRIVAPEFLRDYRPDVVIAMNPVYREEIQRALDDLGVGAELLTVERPIEHVTAGEAASNTLSKT